MLRSPLEGDKPNLACKGGTHTRHASPFLSLVQKILQLHPSSRSRSNLSNRKNVTQMSTAAGGTRGCQRSWSVRERRPRSAGERTRE